MSNVPVLASVRAAFEFRRLHWRAVAGSLSLAALGVALAVGGSLAGDQSLSLVGQIAGVAGSYMAYAGLMRVAFADENPGDAEFTLGHSGFQWRMPEWRLLGVNLVIAFVLVIAAGLFLIAGVLASAMFGAPAKIAADASLEQMLEALGPGPVAILGAVLIASVVAGVYTYARLSLATAATVAQNKVVVFPTWRLTHGQGWRLVAAKTLSFWPSIAEIGLRGALFVALGGKVAAGVPHLPLPLGLALGAVSGLIVAFVQLPVSAGLAAYLYRGLRPAGEK